MRKLSFVLAATDFGPLIVNRMDWNHAPDTADGEPQVYGVCAQLLEKGTCDAEEVEFYKPFLELRRRYFGDGLQVVDCGANVGTITISLAKHIFGYGTVIGIEAQERIFYCLAGNIVLGNHHNARAIWGAVGKRNGILMMPAPDYNLHGSFGSLELLPSKDVEPIGQPISYEKLSQVRTFTIDSMELKRLDLLKIDVERMEIDALDGARETILQHKPILAVEHLKIGVEPIADWLGSVGYDKYMVSGAMVLAVHPTDPVGNHIVMSDDKVGE